jgi:hypothetical protein
MADPLSIAASIIGIAAAGIKLSSTLYTYTETVINADKSVKDIARDLSITSSVITELGKLLGGGDDDDDENKVPLASDSALETTREAVNGCDEVFKDIQKELDKCLDLDYEGKGKARMRRLIWPLVEPKLNTLQTRLERLKNTLVLMLNIMSYAKRESTTRYV